MQVQIQIQVQAESDLRMARLERLVEAAYQHMTKFQTKSAMVRHFRLLTKFNTERSSSFIDEKTLDTARQIC